MNPYLKILAKLYLIVFIYPYQTFSQNNIRDTTKQTSWISKHPIEFSFGSHAIGLPFNHFLSNPFYPEVNIGLQSNLIKNKKINLNMVNGIGFATHPFNGQRYFVNTSLRFKYKFPLNIYCQAGLGLAFNILKYPDNNFELNSNGLYEEQNSLEGELFGGFNIEIGYHFKEINRLEFDLFSKYSAGVNFLHHPGIPIFPYNSTQLGVRFYIHQND